MRRLSNEKLRRLNDNIFLHIDEADEHNYTLNLILSLSSSHTIIYTTSYSSYPLLSMTSLTTPNPPTYDIYMCRLSVNKYNDCKTTSLDLTKVG